MSCPEELEIFLVREGGDELTPERAKEVADHLSSCPECQARLAELKALGDAVARPDPMTEGQKTAFLSSLLKKIDAQERSVPAPAAGLSRFWSVGVPIAAAVCCGVMALVAVPLFLLTAGDEAEPPMSLSMAEQAASPTLAAESEEESNEPFARSADRAIGSSSTLDEGGRGMRHRGEEGRMGSQGFGGGGGASGVRARSTVGGAPSPSAAMPAAPPAPPGSAADFRSLNGVPAEMPAAEADQDDLQRQIASPAKRARMPAAGPGANRGGLLQGRRNQQEATGWQNAPMQPADRMLGNLGAAATARPTSIDANGRFATTYRPGRGHLARFEKTLLEGRVPAAAIDLVADEGRGRGPTIAAPTTQALALDLRPGMTQVPAEGGPVHLAITLRSTLQEPQSRPDVAVHLVMDTSGSMAGTAIENARQAAAQMVTLLQPQDRFSLVTYSNDARVIVPDGVVGNRRDSILRLISTLQPGGGTNLEAGLRQGYNQANASRSVEDSVQLVIVLSDGQPNQGNTDPWALSEMSAAAFQGGVETTTIGVGDSYEPQVMSTIAEYGAGGYYYLPDSSTIEQVLRAELDVRTHPVARGVELRVRLADGVELLQAYGSRRLNEAEAQRVRATEVAIDHQEAHRTGIARDRQEDREGGMRFFIPGFARDDQHTILLRLRVPAGMGAERALAEVELRYKDRVTGGNQGDERTVRVGTATSVETARATLDPEVRRAVYSFRTGEALLQVSGQLATGNSEGALASLYERVEMLRRAAEELDDATLRADAERLDSFRRTLAQRSMGNNLMLGSMLQRAGNGFIR